MWEEMAVVDQPEHLADIKGLINLLQEQGADLYSTWVSRLPRIILHYRC